MEKKLQALMESEEFIDKLFATEEPEDAQKLFADNGLELSIEEIKQLGELFAKEQGSGEMDEDELESVAGGALSLREDFKRLFDRKTWPRGPIFLPKLPRTMIRW